MKTSYEIIYHKLEKHYWWFVGRRNTITTLLNDISRDSKILDIGCSSGVLLSELSTNGFALKNLYGIDISEKAVKAVKHLVSCNAFVMDAQNLEFPENYFDIIIASDCLEHLKNDQAALDNWYKILKQEGKLIVFVPAFNLLWSYHDEINHHFRRYTNKELKEKLENANFFIHKSGYWNFLLFFPAFVLRLINKLLSNVFKLMPNSESGDFKPLNPFINKTLIKLLRAETVLLQYIRFPIGVSTFVVAEKSNSL